MGYSFAGRACICAIAVATAGAYPCYADEPPPAFIYYRCDVANEEIVIAHSAGHSNPQASSKWDETFRVDSLVSQVETETAYGFAYERTESKSGRSCKLSGNTYSVVVEGHFWAGSPNAQCGIGSTATITISNAQGKVLLDEFQLEDCYSGKPITTRIRFVGPTQEFSYETMDSWEFYWGALGG